jgi:dihydropyrimidine dehydrogenase (NAD+) subunit PreA
MARVKEPSLEVTFAGVKFKSPIGVGAIGRPNGRNITTEMHAEVLLKHVEAGASYIVVPTCIYVSEETISKLKQRAVPEETPPLLPAGNRGMRASTPAPYGIDGMYFFVAPIWGNIEWGKEHGRETEELTKVIMERKPKDIPVIANVMGYSDLPDSWVDAAKKWEKLGVDLIEINVSCPGPPTARNAVEYFLEKKYPARFMGALIGDHADLVENITRAVVKAVNIPVGVKLSPETGFPRVVGIAKRVKDAGAKWIETVNCAITIAPPDIYNGGKQMWQFTDANPFVSATGSWLRRDSYRDVAAIAKFVPGLDIAAAGGLVAPRHSVEVMMLGARQVQLCTGVMERGRSLIRQSVGFLKKFLAEQGYQSVEEIIGLGQRYIKYIEEVNASPGLAVAVHDESKCNNCGQCVDNICTATYLENGSPKVREEDCTGCGCCS